MSIVGTRPPLISETNLYEPRHKARLAIKPGITGMWQVSGRSDMIPLNNVIGFISRGICCVCISAILFCIIWKKRLDILKTYL